MTDNIEWGEWVDAGPVLEVSQKTKGKFCEIRYSDNFGRPIAYRIGAPRQPVVTTQVLYWGFTPNATVYRSIQDTHRIIITLHDGKPVGIAIEELK